MQTLKDDIRAIILSAATEEFLQKGFADASMRAIADRAGVSTSNMYNYFKNKEDLFYDITDSVRHDAMALVKGFLTIKTENRFNNEDFMQQFITLVPRAIFQLMKQRRKELLILLDCSSGTRHEGIRTTIAETLSKYFIQNMKAVADDTDRSFLMHILAMNLLQGLIEIGRKYKNDSWTEKNIHSLMSYHIRGMVQFME